MAWETSELDVSRSIWGDYNTEPVTKDNIKVGDEVIVTRKAESYENGWVDIWASPQMDDFIGKELKVIDFNGDSVSLEYKSYSYCFPYFVLRKVENKKTMSWEEKVDFIDEMKWGKLQSENDAISFNPIDIKDLKVSDFYDYDLIFITKDGEKITDISRIDICDGSIMDVDDREFPFDNIKGYLKIKK